jgi:hypothetical protein
MRSQRGMSTLGAVLLSATAGLLTATLLMDWMVVDVHVVDVSPHDDIELSSPVHIKVPFPLAVASVATSFIPDEAFEDAEIPPEVTAQKELVIETVRALLESPDSTLVSVLAPDAKVEIVKDGDTLRIAVDAEDAVVRCNVPIDGVLTALENWDWETADPGMLFDMLHAAENGDLVTVATDDGVRVAIKMW